MSIRTSPWPTGVPCWVDLTTPDVPVAREFYSAVLGWDYRETGGEYGGYVIAHKDGNAAAGIGPQYEGAPIAWTMYFASDDADDTSEAVVEQGGSILWPPNDVGDLGRMFLATDPTGAAFGVWAPRSFIGASLVNEPGGLVWDDLRTGDPDTARAFYSAVFGFGHDPVDQAPPDYQTYRLLSEETPLGGMGGFMGPGAEAGGAPPHWVVYFGVADVAAAVTTAQEAGARVLMQEMDTPYGAMAGVQDPAGAMFFVIDANTASQPDRSG